MRELDYEGLPEGLRNGIRLYIEQHIPPGGFLMSVLSNDLKEACMRADIYNLPKLPDIVEWLFEQAPMACWGSPLHVKDWLDQP